MVYFLTFAFLAISAFAYDFGGVKAWKEFNYWVALALLILIAGFRYEVGGDTRNYMIAFQFTPNLSEILGYSDARGKIQPLWLLFSSVAKTISPSFYSLQIMQAIVVNTAVFIFFKRATNYYFTAILIYSVGAYPMFNFEVMREAMAISLFLCAYPAYRDGRWKAFYFFIVLAFLFHASALFLFFLPLLRRRQPPIILAPIVFLAGAALEPSIRGYLGGGDSFGGLLGYASVYDDYTATGRGLVSLFILFVLFPMALLYIISGVLKEKTDPIRTLVATGIWVGAATSSFFIFFRLLNYFTPIYMVAAGIAVHRVYRFRGTLPLRAMVASILLCGIFFIYTFRYFSDTSAAAYGTRWYMRWYPYYSILDEREDSAREEARRRGL